MTDRAGAFTLWSPRIAALLVGAGMSVFALDAFSGDRGFLASLPDFLLHLVPALAILGVIYIAWRRPSFGAIVFFSLAALYGLTTVDRPSWILAIGGPLALTGVLYVVSWRWTRIHARRTAEAPGITARS